MSNSTGQTANDVLTMSFPWQFVEACDNGREFGAQCLERSSGSQSMNSPRGTAAHNRFRVVMD
jgi:hypothetical protein